MSERLIPRPDSTPQVAIEALETVFMSFMSALLFRQGNALEVIEMARAGLQGVGSDAPTLADQHARQVLDHGDWILAMMGASIENAQRHS